jgi:hypothetical protein
VQDPAAAIGTLGFDEAEAAKKREGLSKHQRTAADLWGLIRSRLPRRPYRANVRAGDDASRLMGALVILAGPMVSIAGWSCSSSLSP